MTDNRKEVQVLPSVDHLPFANLSERLHYALLALFATSLKLLLIPSYYSTDFDVHRNWLAITNSLPLSEWYFEKTSEWTLDYPPFFAYFERVLAFLAPFFDPSMLRISEAPYRSYQTVLFQRFTVILTDMVYMLALYTFANSSKCSPKAKVIFFGVLAFNPGLLMLDHVHFQYNGMLFGLLLLSIAYICQGEVILGAIVFAVTLNFKHLFLYVAPVYFIFLLGNYCFTNQGSTSRFNVLRFLSLGVAVALVFALSFGPFILLDQLGQVLSRLFPFQRGLCHAYWAPNFWTLYNVADKIAIAAYKYLHLTLPSLPTANMTGGLVGEVSHVVLPTVKPFYTMLIIIISILPLMKHLWSRPNITSFKASLVVCSLSFYMFGWHVHEKAILTTIIPLGLLINDGAHFTRAFFFLSTVGHYTLFPLLFPAQEIPTRNLIWMIHTLLSYIFLKQIYSDNKKEKFSLSFLEFGYLVGLVGIEALNLELPVFAPNYPFLPLLITSLYCSFGVVYSYVCLYFYALKT
eukprot:TRINITY_DN7220_c0_g1_i1.p1 TRINITY_DN7220_c0_g1~~TRINITY_DN7220_c0_g1_i1.p1  ORF type:complete len:518 (-),score=58.58 TRINITY_DN7220_c0_g1_i1:163-1716(-)